MSDKPLNGIWVLDVTNVLAGPFACHQLAGCDIVAIEIVYLSIACSNNPQF
jgi:formyl-CoA transferase